MIGPNVTIATAAHPILPALRKKAAQYNLPVRIGDNVWIGAGAIILPGVTIGPEDQEYYCRSRNMKIQPEDLT